MALDDYSCMTLRQPVVCRTCWLTWDGCLSLSFASLVREVSSEAQRQCILSMDISKASPKSVSSTYFILSPASVGVFFE